MSFEMRSSLNRFLAAWSGPLRSRLFCKLDLVQVKAGTVLYDASDTLRDAYFPTDSVISLYAQEAGLASELGIVGNDGFAGATLSVGGGLLPNLAVVRASGYAYQLSGHLLKAEFKRSAAMRALTLSYMRGLLVQMSWNSHCAQAHSVEQRLCRWLMLCIDRQPSTALRIPGDQLPHLLDGDPGVPAALAALQADGIIACERGELRVRNPAGLLQRACDCYRALSEECDAKLPVAAPADLPTIPVRRRVPMGLAVPGAALLS